ncbi:MAG TPA: amylo-alpha-1,6-glucosidase [Nostocaceae cyanobacterium]|nr:amylo-alpha-1,6-glucosidase [Nostocaceae cyanobacterium]
MSELDLREWLLTNGLGGFASGTVTDVRTRTYHGWLFAAINPPSSRNLLLSHLEASLEVPGKVIALGTNLWGSGQIEPNGYKLLRSFDINPVPAWVWGEDNWQLTRRLVMGHGWRDGEMGRTNNISPVTSHQSPITNPQNVLIQYRYEGKIGAVLKLRPLIGDRDFHHQQKESQELRFSQLLGEKLVCLQAIYEGKFCTPWHLRWTKGEYRADAFWYWNYGLLEEARRGLGDREDLYSPGYLTVPLQPGETITLEARVGFPNPQTPILTPESFDLAVLTEQNRLAGIFPQEDAKTQTGKRGELTLFPNTQYPIPNTQSPIYQQLLKAADQFIVYRASIAGPTVIAGYHWFNDWGRDTLIALPGLALVPKRYDLAKGLLRTFGRFCNYGLIPNAFPDQDDEPFYNSIDAALWWIETLGLYLEATEDWEFLAEQYPVVQQIHKAFIGGTLYNIHVDAIDSLVSWEAHGVALTWMDAVYGGIPVTPRCGKPVEINALWYSALCWASKWAEKLSQLDIGNSVKFANQAQRYAQQAENVKASLQKFWNPQLGYLYDVIELDDRRNAQIRPNAVIALSLYHCGFPVAQGQQILDLATDRLLTPYGLRSLDPQDSQYLGKYEGNMQKRDRAYHQGTVWTWLIGPYIRAWQRFYPQQPIPFDWQPLINHFLRDACIGSISEIFEGDEPHTPRGAIAQAWSVAEIIRHFQI